MELRDFYTPLAQAVAWCAPRASAADPEHSLRTPALRPRALAPNRAEAVADVCRRRELYLGRAVPRRAEAFTDLAGGRLLAYFPDAELSDGAAELETRGFFDVFNAPPWDTWVAYFEDQRSDDASYRAYLVAYIPPALLDLAGRGIDVNPESCIVWLADTQTELARQLQRSGART